MKAYIPLPRSLNILTNVKTMAATSMLCICSCGEWPKRSVLELGSQLRSSTILKKLNMLREKRILLGGIPATDYRATRSQHLQNAWVNLLFIQENCVDIK